LIGVVAETRSDVMDFRSCKSTLLCLLCSWRKTLRTDIVALPSANH